MRSKEWKVNMNFNNKLSMLKDKKEAIHDWNKELYHLCNNISLPVTTRKWSTTQYLFRARKINSILDLQQWNKNDFGARKSYKITEYGRLNKPYEEMLYFNNDFHQTLKEIDYDYQTPVVVSAYQVIEPFMSTQIAYENKNQLMDVESKACLDWFRDLFSDNADIASEICNQITTAIREDFYTLAIDIAQAWSYPIVGEQIKGMNNVAMYPGPARQHLNFVGAIVISDVNSEGKMNVEFCFDPNYRLDYVKGYSELKEIFVL